VKTILIVATAAALLIPSLGLGIFPQNSGAQIAGRTPSVFVIQSCKQGGGQPGNVDLAVVWNVEEPWDEAYVDTTIRSDGFERGLFGGTPAGTPQPSSDATTWPGFQGRVTVEGWGGFLTFLRLNLRYGDTWYPSPVLSFMVETCSGGTVVLPPTTSGTGNEAAISDLEQRLDHLETATFGYLGVPAFGTSLKDRMDSLVSCVNDNIKALTSPQPRLWYCD
jgi:hypothetical protein